MNTYTNPFVVAAAAPATRADFYRKTYLLVAVACAVFGLLLAGILATPAIVNPLTGLFFGNGSIGWLLVLAAFWGISMLANRLAFGGVSTGTQLAGLGVYVLAEALLFAPMLNILMYQFGQEAALSEIVAPAALSTLLLAGGLTATVFMTKTDFSFLRAFISIGFFVALGAMLLLMFFGGIGTWFVIAMTVFIAAVILYQTWMVKTQFRPDQHVGAALIIFAGIATLFWYLIMIFAERRE
ncbi:MAG: permease [Verrucomicrobia bacterium]|nr:permease [Verrucomicrobiota bacterium]